MKKLFRKNLLTQRPQRNSILVSLSFVLLVGIISQWAWNLPSRIDRFAVINASIFEDYELWRVLTGIFLHSNLQHYLSNSYMIFVLGVFLYGYFGFVVFPLISLFLGAITNLLSSYTYPSDVQLIGASGLAYVMAGVWLSMFFLIARQHTIRGRILRVLGVGLITLFPSSFEPNICYRTHGIGFLLGTIFGVSYYFFKSDYFRSFDSDPVEEVSDDNSSKESLLTE